MGDMQAKAKKALKRYHHGNLRDALVSEARRLISELGLDRFKIADACRCLGVSTAAPYRHFPDRDALLHAVCSQAFVELFEELKTARERHPRGTVDAVTEIGKAYLAFVTRDPELFELMWGSMHTDLGSEDEAEALEIGSACFKVLTDAIDDVRAEQGLESVRTVDVALPLWSFVQGLASLKMRDKLKIVENADPERTIEVTTRAIFDGFRKQAQQCDQCD